LNGWEAVEKKVFFSGGKVVGKAMAKSGCSKKASPVATESILHNPKL